MSDVKVQIHTLSSGVKFSVGKQVPPLLMIDTLDSFPDPQVPQIEVQGMGGRKVKVDNPEDPRYVARLEAQESKRNIALMSLILRMSIKLESELPDNEDWLVTPMKIVGKDKIEEILAEKGGVEYLYLRYVGVQTNEDMTKLFRASSVTEEGVAEKVEAF